MWARIGSRIRSPHWTVWHAARPPTHPPYLRAPSPMAPRAQPSHVRAFGTWKKGGGKHAPVLNTKDMYKDFERMWQTEAHENPRLKEMEEDTRSKLLRDTRDPDLVDRVMGPRVHLRRPQPPPEQVQRDDHMISSFDLSQAPPEDPLMLEQDMPGEGEGGRGLSHRRHFGTREDGSRITSRKEARMLAALEKTGGNQRMAKKLLQEEQRARKRVIEMQRSLELERMLTAGAENGGEGEDSPVQGTQGRAGDHDADSPLEGADSARPLKDQDAHDILALAGGAARDTRRKYKFSPADRERFQRKSAEQVQRVVLHYLRTARQQSLRSPHLSITHAESNIDGSVITLYWTSQPGSEDATHRAFAKSMGDIRAFISRRLPRKYVPHVTFKYDEQTLNDQRIHSLMNEEAKFFAKKPAAEIPNIYEEEEKAWFAAQREKERLQEEMATLGLDDDQEDEVGDDYVIPEFVHRQEVIGADGEVQSRYVSVEDMEDQYLLDRDHGQDSKVLYDLESGEVVPPEDVGAGDAIDYLNPKLREQMDKTEIAMARMADTLWKSNPDAVGAVFDEQDYLAAVAQGNEMTYQQQMAELVTKHGDQTGDAWKGKQGPRARRVPPEIDYAAHMADMGDKKANRRRRRSQRIQKVYMERMQPRELKVTWPRPNQRKTF